MSALFLAPDNPGLDQLLLAHFADEHGGFPVSRAVLLGRDGHEIAAWRDPSPRTGHHRAGNPRPAGRPLGDRPAADASSAPTCSASTARRR